MIKVEYLHRCNLMQCRRVKLNDDFCIELQAFSKLVAEDCK